MRYKNILLWLLMLLSLFFSCKNNGVEINGVYSDEELKDRLGAPEYEKMIVLKPDTFINLYEYQSGLYQFMPEKDSLIVLEQGYKNGSNKKILWLTGYENKKRVLDILEYNPQKIQF
ncbi:MAG: hypothetical protein IKZ92_02920 [Muribaculaceae bacterium]|nr:hypothetical protein [Muribaculaceae bacterium]